MGVHDDSIRIETRVIESKLRLYFRCRPVLSMKAEDERRSFIDVVVLRNVDQEGPCEPISCRPDAELDTRSIGSEVRRKRLPTTSACAYYWRNVVRVWRDVADQCSKIGIVGSNPQACETSLHIARSIISRRLAAWECIAFLHAFMNVGSLSTSGLRGIGIPTTVDSIVGSASISEIADEPSTRIS